MKEFKIIPIRNGTVLDHIEAGKSPAIIAALGYPIPGSSKVISLSMNLPSKLVEAKDVLKLEDHDLSDDELAAIKALSKHGTVCVIRNFDVARKTSWGL